MLRCNGTGVGRGNDGVDMRVLFQGHVAIWEGAIVGVRRWCFARGKGREGKGLEMDARV